MSFQHQVDAWMDACFGPEIKADRLERADRFIEEALELVQTEPTFTAERAHALIDYVFARPVGVAGQEVGGVMVTLAALCNAVGIDIHDVAEVELARVWTKVEAIRAKQAAKPTGSALPVALDVQQDVPVTDDFMIGVADEMAHQVRRWGTAHDRGKEPADWFWLVGYLAGKALASHLAGDAYKALHHTISSAAALGQWHAAISGSPTAMMPGADMPERQSDLEVRIAGAFGDDAVTS